MNNKTKYLHFYVSDFTLENCIESIKNHLELNTTYSMLIKFSNEDMFTFKTAGAQIGLTIKDSFDPYYLEFLYGTIKDRIEATLENYEDLSEVGMIELMFVTITQLETPPMDNLNSLQLSNHTTGKIQAKKNFNKKLLPLTMNTKFYGELVNSEFDRTTLTNLITLVNNTNFDVNDVDKFYMSNSDTIVLVKKCKDGHHIYIFNRVTGIIIKSIKDKILEQEKNVVTMFVRTIDATSFKIKNNSEVLELQQVSKLSPIHKKTIASERDSDKLPSINNNFGTFDIETFQDEFSNDVPRAYALGFAVQHSKEAKLYYLSDSFDNLGDEPFIYPLPNVKQGEQSYSDKLQNLSDSDKLVFKCIKDMLAPKYDKYIWYTHNLGDYDSIFLLSALLRINVTLGLEYYQVQTIMRDDSIIKLTVSIKKDPGNPLSKKNKIIFVDSLNLLNSSLAKLANDFDVAVRKGNFPYSFVTRSRLNYIGKKPNIDYYSNISNSEYDDIEPNNWDLRLECLKYLKDDLISLLLIMDKFNTLTNIYHRTDTTKALTITRLSLNVFLEHYYETKIPSITSKHMFNFVKDSYFGGLTEVYIPYGEDLVSIDINSLYPFASLNSVPGLNVTWLQSFTSTGLNLDNLFGFFKAKVKTNDSYFGLLPLHINDRMILPNGEFYGTWSSEELKFARDNGYDLTVIEGYNFDKAEKVFDKYVNTLYDIKAKTKGSKRQIAKSLLNNLIGRLGLNIFKPMSKLVNIKELEQIMSTRLVSGCKSIDGGRYLVTYFPSIDKNVVTQHGNDYIQIMSKNYKDTTEKSVKTFQDVSITTAAMILAHARTFMNKTKLFIEQNGGKIYYTDTDSFVIDRPSLDLLIKNNYIGSKLGQFKVEHFVKKAYFISNKTYCLELNNGDCIIKAKGINSDYLSLNDFKDLYLHNKNIEAIRNNTKILYDKGSVLINTKNVVLKHDSYTKREKVYDNKGLWVDTKPLILTNKNEE